jgi:hypothetical protein
VGAITDYNPYYPPRVGLQVSWYSPHPWAFLPGVPTEPFARKAILESEYCPDEECEPPMGRWGRFKHWVKRRTGKAYAEHSTLFRGQSDAVFPPRSESDQSLPEPPDPAPPRALIRPEAPPEVPPPVPPDVLENPPVLPVPSGALTQAAYEPLMSYTRLFDGASAELTATFRDYLELRDDLRSGGWTASLFRTEDFIRFTSHQMIVEMLALHGGETRHRVVFVWRREK